jgi:hypothetical protein
MKLALIALLPLCFAASAEAQDAAATNKPREVRIVRASSPPSIDGQLDEPAWQSAPVVDWFVQKEPNQGAAPSQKTEVRVLYDADAIYVGARMHDAHADSIVKLLLRKDGQGRSDAFKVYLDPYHDGRSGFYFCVNSAGTLYDGTLYNDSWSDNSWDAVWSASSRVDAHGWTAEMKIPFSQIRCAKRDVQVWGINFGREMGRHFEDDLLVYQPRNESGFVSRFPDLVGLENVSPGSAVEVVPYLTSKAEYLRHHAFDPFNDGSRFTADLGGDLRMALGSKLTLNGTINPDFGQVEVDPAVVNLSDFETFFPEKRPFFVEGRSIFEAGQQGASDYWGFNWAQPTFFYSRRIGRTPQGSTPDDAELLEAPLGTTILGAAKLTGKLNSNWNFGTLHALTAKESADLVTRGARRDWEVEPLTYYGIARGLRQFADGRRGFGLLGNATVRTFDEERLKGELNEGSFMAGTDGWTFLDSDREWVISGWTAMTHVTGTSDRITALQQDPRHYFQRPDASHVDVDTDATSLSGIGSRYWLNKQKGNVFMNAAAGFMTPGFELNDVGFLSRTDVINAHLGAGYRWTEPKGSIKNKYILGAAYGGYDFQGNLTAAGLFSEGAVEFANNNSWNFVAQYIPPYLDTRRTRGGPVMERRQGYALSTYFDTDSKSKLFYYLQLNHGGTPSADTWDAYVEPGVEWKPSSSLTLRLGPSLSRVKQNAQYLATYDDPTAGMTFGRRYVFGELDQTTLAANLRANWAFTPSLSFQCFVQPLISAGDYSNVKSLARARSFDFDRYADASSGTLDADGGGPAPAYALGDPDFNFRSLRGNAVLRWEYLPGSTLFLVWTQERTDEETLGQVDFDRSIKQLFKADATNIFLVKGTYYFTL